MTYHIVMVYDFTQGCTCHIRVLYDSSLNAMTLHIYSVIQFLTKGHSNKGLHYPISQNNFHTIPYKQTALLATQHTSYTKTSCSFLVNLSYHFLPVRDEKILCSRKRLDLCILGNTSSQRFLREVVYSFSLCFQTGIQRNSIKRYLNKNIFV